MGVILVTLAALAVAVLLSLHRMVATLDQVNEELVIKAHPIITAERLLLVGERAVRDYLLSGNAQERRRFETLAGEIEHLLETAEKASERSIEQRALLETAREDWRRARQLGSLLVGLDLSAAEVGYAADLQRFSQSVGHVRETLARVDQFAHQEVSAAVTAGYAVWFWVLWFVAAIIGLEVLIGIGAWLVLGRSVLHPVQRLEEAARHFGNGNLAQRVALEREDELGRLADTFNAMAEKLERTQAALEQLSIHDGLTGLCNYREFHRRLAEELERAQRYHRPLSLLMLDLDHFKRINDHHGHQAGDEMLRQFARIMSQQVRPIDLVARYGGEEFTVILPETDSGGAVATAERIRRAIARQVIAVARGTALRMTVSIGVAVFPADATTGDKLITAADRALYAAKRAGRNRVVAGGDAA